MGANVASTDTNQLNTITGSDIAMERLEGKSADGVRFEVHNGVATVKNSAHDTLLAQLIALWYLQWSSWMK